MSKTIIPSWTAASESALTEVAAILQSAVKAADLIKAKPGSAAAVKALAALVAAREALEK